MRIIGSSFIPDRADHNKAIKLGRPLGIGLLGMKILKRMTLHYLIVFSRIVIEFLNLDWLYAFQDFLL